MRDHLCAQSFQLDSRLLSLFAGRHSRAFIDCRFSIDQRGSLPGLCPPAPGSGAHARTAGSIRFGLSGSGTDRVCREQAGGGDWRPSVARLGRGVDSGKRLDGRRPHAWRSRRPSARAIGVWPRLRRCRAGARRLQGPCGAAPLGGRPGAPGSGRRRPRATCQDCRGACRGAGDGTRPATRATTTAATA